MEVTFPHLENNYGNLSINVSDVGSPLVSLGSFKSPHAAMLNVRAQNI